MPTVSGIPNDILITGFDEMGRDHKATLDKVLKLGRQANLKLNDNKCILGSPANLFGKKFHDRMSAEVLKR